LLDLVNIEPVGQYARRIWFLLEWVDGQPIAGKEPVKKKGYIAVLDERLQFGVAGVKSPRHAVVNNLPGTPQFCPLIFKTERLVRAVAWDSSGAYAEAVRGVEPDSVRRAAACGLGQLQLASLEAAERHQVRERALSALVAGCTDGEWVVRYAVAVGLEALGRRMEPLPQQRQRTLTALEALSRLELEPTPVVRLRARLAQQRLQEQKP